MNILVNLIKKDIYARHMGSIFGVIWSLANPLITTLTYLIIFKYVFPNRDEKFVLHLLTGIVHWTLFISVILQSCEWMTGNASILKKVYFPRFLVPISGFLVALYFWLYFFLLFVLSFHFFGGVFGIHLLIYPVILMFYLMFLFGLGLMMSIFYVTMRDLKYMTEILIPICFWLVPIIWVSGNISSEKIQFILNFNPLGVFFRAFEAIFYSGQMPALIDIIAASVLGSLVLFMGIKIFKKRSCHVIEYF